MITRFRLETLGISKEDCQRQLEEAVLGIMALDGSSREDWQITDDVSSKIPESTVYEARIVLKRRGVSERDTLDTGRSAIAS